MRDVCSQGEDCHCGAGQAYLPLRELLIAGYCEARSDGSERQQKRLVETHMTLWSYAPEFSRSSPVSGGFKRLWLKTETDGLFQMIEVREDYEQLVRAIIGIRPAFTDGRIEEV